MSQGFEGSAFALPILHHINLKTIFVATGYYPILADKAVPGDASIRKSGKR